MSRPHQSDCAMHNRPARPLKECDCGAGMNEEDWRALVRDSYAAGLDEGREQGYALAGEED